MIFIGLIIVGIASGILGGMGMGGGTLLIPLLTLLFNFNQKVAQGLNLLSFSIMAIIIIFFHLKNKLIDMKVAIQFAIIALLSSVVGAMLANIVNAKCLKVFYGVLLISISIFQIIQELRKYYDK